jgi:L-lactate dehydrogenase complex protein LldG
MTDQRDKIIGKLKTALNRESRSTDEARARLVTPPINLIPERGDDSSTDKINRFINEAEKVEATVEKIASIEDLPASAAAYMAAHNLPMRIRVAASLSGAPWAGQPLLTMSSGIADGSDVIGISRAFGAVAETGTLVFLSGPDNPTTINFLPPNHIAVIAADEIAGNYERVWQRIRSAWPQTQTAPGKTDLPRTVNWITGPSRTADIEQTLLLGIHGPQRLHIVVVDDVK